MPNALQSQLFTAGLIYLGKVSLSLDLKNERFLGWPTGYTTRSVHLTYRLR